MNEERVAVVTGASAGIGVAIARGLAARGLRVAIGARRRDRLDAVAAEIERDGGRAFAHELDVAQPESIEAFVTSVEEHFGPVDVAVANAGISVPGLLHEVPAAAIQAEIATNLVGPMLLARRCIPAMRARGSGELVFISSDNARAPRPFQAGYSASKAGVESLARVLAMELEGTGVRASTVRMGPVSSEFGHDWEPEMMGRVLRSWQHFGLVRGGVSFMSPETIASAIVGIIDLPRGAIVAKLELQPEPKRSLPPGHER